MDKHIKDYLKEAGPEKAQKSAYDFVACNLLLVLRSEDKDIALKILSENPAGLSECLFNKKALTKEAIRLLSWFLHPSLPKRVDPVPKEIELDSQDLRDERYCMELLNSASNRNVDIVEYLAKQYSEDYNVMTRLLDDLDNKALLKEVKQMSKRMSHVYLNV